MLHIPRVIDHDSGRQRGDRDFIGAKSGQALAADEPIEQFVAWLEEPDAVAGQGEGAGRSSGV